MSCSRNHKGLSNTSPSENQASTSWSVECTVGRTCVCVTHLHSQHTHAHDSSCGDGDRTNVLHPPIDNAKNRQGRRDTEKTGGEMLVRVPVRIKPASSTPLAGVAGVVLQQRNPPSPSSSLSSPLRWASSPLSIASASAILRHCMTTPSAPALCCIVRCVGGVRSSQGGIAGSGWDALGCIFCGWGWRVTRWELTDHGHIFMGSICLQRFREPNLCGILRVPCRKKTTNHRRNASYAL